MAHELKEKKKIMQVEVVNLHPVMCVFTDSFILSNPGQNYTVRELHHCITYSAHFFTGKMIVTASKKYFSIVVPQLDGRVFPIFVAKLQSI